MPKPPTSVDPYQWTLSLPPGQHCSVGLSTNMTVSADGNQSPGGRANEDKFFTCSSHDNNTQVYLVLDGHDGVRACEFVRKHLPTVFLENVIRDERSLLECLKRSFLSTEREFFVRIDPHITRKMTLQFEIDQKAINSAEAYRLYPGQVAEIQRLDEEIKGGTTAVMSVVFKNKLYVANCGDSRAVLCSEDTTGKMIAKQISVDHNTQDEKELERLAEVGLDPHTLRRSKRLGTQQNTRSIGDYTIKGGYHDIDIIAHAKGEPGTAEPYIASPIDLTGFRGFLLLMTDGLYEAYEAWTHRPAKVNEDIAHLVAKEIKDSTEFHLVAQRVVEKVKNVFLQSCKTEKHIGRLDDITLIVRNFGFPHLSHSQSHPDVAQSKPQPTMPATAPVVHGASQASNMFFNPTTTSSQNLPYYHDVPPTRQPGPYIEFSATSLPPSMLEGRSQAGYGNVQQPPYQTNAQPYDNGTMSMGGGGFIPEPGSPDYQRQTGYVNSGTASQGGYPPANIGTVGQGGYVQTNTTNTGQGGYVRTNDYGYSVHGPLSNLQRENFDYRPQPQRQHQSVAPSSSYPAMSQLFMRDRQQSVPVVTTNYGSHRYQHSTQRPSSSGMTNPRRNQEYYENTNPLNTDQIQSESSSSRSSTYENVKPHSRDTSAIEQADYYEEQLREKVHKVGLHDTPQKPNVSSTATEKKTPPSTVANTASSSAYTPTASTYTPSASTYTPPEGRKTPVAAAEATTPVAELQAREKMTRRDSDLENYELYGWSVEDEKSLYDTLKEEELEKPAPVVEPKFFTKVEPPIEATPPSQTVPATLPPADDEETMVVDLNEIGEFETEPSDHESEDVDGEVRACVKFSTTFPEISWDDIKV